MLPASWIFEQDESRCPGTNTPGTGGSIYSNSAGSLTTREELTFAVRTLSLRDMVTQLSRSIFAVGSLARSKLASRKSAFRKVALFKSAFCKSALLKLAPTMKSHRQARI